MDRIHGIFGVGDHILPRFCSLGCLRSVGWVLCVAVTVEGADPDLVVAEGVTRSPTHLADELLASGLKAYHRGDFAKAIKDWRQSRHAYDRAGSVEGQIDTLRNQAVVLRAQGKFPTAIEHLGSAVQLAETLDDDARRIAVHNDLGAVLTLTRDLTQAQSHFDQCLALVTQDEDDSAMGSILNNMGNLATAQGMHGEALQFYKRSAEIAERVGHGILSAQALVNAAMAAAASEKFQEAHDLDTQALSRLQNLPQTHDRANLLITIGSTEQRLLRQLSPERRAEGLALARQAYQSAIRAATATQDGRALAYASGYLGRLYESEGQFDRAMAMTRQAVFAAQRAQIPDALYQWYWQSGRLYQAQEQLNEALAAYRRAVETFGVIWHDVAVGRGNRDVASSFRQEVGQLFFDMADVLLQRAQLTDDPDQARHDLWEARRTIERFKTNELVDYFQDECVDMFDSRIAHIENISPDTAIVYMIPLQDRTELLLSFHGGDLERFTVNVNRDQLSQAVKRFRIELEDLSSARHQRYAKQLYRWLMIPIRPTLQARHIDTLVFVPDGVLRLIPMAALHDGRQFLIQQYATAITPGLTLIDPQPLERHRGQVLACGLSEINHGDLPPLEHVSDEVEGIAQLFRGTKLLGEEFVLHRLEQEIAHHPYSIVHFASHGQFGHSAEQTFVLTYDSKLTLSGLAQLIQPTRFRDRPVELLALSACQTAAGDDRAALGLAGVALRAGARSAVATLWSVQDNAAALLLHEFYKQIKQDHTMSKAKAMQRAQRMLLEQQWMYDDPYFWSPFLVIGNWL